MVECTPVAGGSRLFGVGCDEGDGGEGERVESKSNVISQVSLEVDTNTQHATRFIFNHVTDI